MAWVIWHRLHLLTHQDRRILNAEAKSWEAASGDGKVEDLEVSAQKAALITTVACVAVQLGVVECYAWEVNFLE